MRVGVVVDSTCDLPAKFLKQQGIVVLPINLRLGAEHLLDVRDPNATIDFYSRYPVKRQYVQTAPPTTNQIIEALAGYAAKHLDRLLVVTISSTRSKIFEHLNNAKLPLLNAIRKKRKLEQIKGSFNLHVHDSKTIFTGQAVLVHEMARLLRDEHLGFDELCHQANALSNSIYAYLVPHDLYYLRKRASKKGERSIGWLRYQAGKKLDIKPIIRAYQGDTEVMMSARGFDKAIEKLLDVAINAIDKGLKTNMIALSYAGESREMNRHPLIREFFDYAHIKGVKVTRSSMSTTAGVHVGPGALSLAYAV